MISTCFLPALMAADAAQKIRPPLPKPKPPIIATPDSASSDEQAPADSSNTAASEPEAQPTRTAIVIPREKPPELRKPGPEILPAPAPDSERSKGQDEVEAAPGENLADCRHELADLGARFTIPDMATAESKCKVINPVRISAIASPAGDVNFPDGPILNCIFAKQFTTWVSDVAAPVVKERSGQALAAMSTGPGYECRGRNGDSSAKISEHASGNAIDIVSFRLASKQSTPVANVAKTGNAESRWLMALRISACGYFTTVLGPGSNAAHATHYHLDLGVHGKSANYKICE
jgi:hypothetical protein